MNTLPSTLERRPVQEFTEVAYLDYAMHVILDRALPALGDGLKPVQRRIVYGMSELGLQATAKYKKSARTVGDVLGKFHPHSDGACYEAMVLMAQPFSTRYPLIDGQGNWGSIDDPKSFAAMRYTEAKLTPYAQSLLQELGQGTVDWGPNFDGTLHEPLTLPAQLPNVLLNGATGIAVGMATDIPPHNCREVVAALLHLLDHPDATVEALWAHCPAPDYPTGGVLVSEPEAMRKVYETGRGSVKLRARVEDAGDALIIEELPYQVSSAKVLQQVATQMQAKQLPTVTDLRDESDQAHPTRLVLGLRSNRVDKDALLAHLYATTDLEVSCRIHFNVIGLNRRPKTHNLRELCDGWLTFRKATTRRRLEHRLDAIERRQHVLEGLLLVFDHLDEVIRIVRTSDDPEAKLCERFGLTEVQAQAILAIRLRQLAKLVEAKLRDEAAALAEERAQILHWLEDEVAFVALIKSELQAAAEAYGDARRTRWDQNAAPAVRAQAAAGPQRGGEAVTVLLSKKQWVRVAKGHGIDDASLHYKSGDGPSLALAGHFNQDILLLDAQGRSYRLDPSVLPSARSMGEPVTKFLKLEADIAHMLWVAPKDEVLMLQDAGYGFVAPADVLLSKNKRGRASMKCKQGSTPAHLLTLPTGEPAYCALVTRAGRLLVLEGHEVPRLDGGMGNKLVQIRPEDRPYDRLVMGCWLEAEATLWVWRGKTRLSLKPEDWMEYVAPRGRRGRPLPKAYCQSKQPLVLEAARR